MHSIRDASSKTGVRLSGSLAYPDIFVEKNGCLRTVKRGLTVMLSWLPCRTWLCKDSRRQLAQPFSMIVNSFFFNVLSSGLCPVPTCSGTKGNSTVLLPVCFVRMVCVQITSASRVYQCGK